MSCRVAIRSRKVGRASIAKDELERNFPTLDEILLEDYRAGVSEDEWEEFEGWFGVEQVVGQQRCGAVEGGSIRHVVSASLFWKHVNGRDPDLPAPTREILVDAKRMGLVKRFAPWESYIAPLLDYGPSVLGANPEVEFRLHLAGDLFFLAEELAAMGWVVYVMKSASLRYCPGGFWRFLPLGDPHLLVTVIDTDRMAECGNELGRTRVMAEMGLGLWRVPGYYNADLSRQVRYRPILGGHFGAAGGIPIRVLMEAFVWHWRRGSLPLRAKVPGVGERPIQFANWPDYGFDEWFLLAAVYPHLAPSGTLTFIPSDARSLLLPADIEYATWANPRSECVYF